MEVTLAERAAAGLPHRRESLGQQVIERFAVFETLLELVRHRAQLVVGERLEVGLDLIDGVGERLEFAQDAAFAGAKHLLQDHVDSLPVSDLVRSMVGARQITGWLARDRPARISVCRPTPSPLRALHIRPWQNSDVEQITVICQDPLIQRWTAAVPIPYTRADAEFLVSELAPKGWADGSESAGPSPTRPPTRCWEPSACGSGTATAATSATGWLLRVEAGEWRRRPSPRCAGRDSGWGCRSCTGRRWRATRPRGGWLSGSGSRSPDPVRRLLFQRGDWVDGWVGTLLPDDPPMAAPAVLTDGVVTLRAPRGSDLAALPDLVDEQVLAWTGVPGRSPEELGRWLDVVRRPARPPAARFAITDGADQVLGFIRLSQEADGGIHHRRLVARARRPRPGGGVSQREARARPGQSGRELAASPPASSTATPPPSRWPSGSACGRKGCGARTGRRASRATRVATPGCTPWCPATRDGRRASPGLCDACGRERSAAPPRDRPRTG